MKARQHARLSVTSIRFTLRSFLLLVTLIGAASGCIVGRALYVAHVIKCVPEIEKYRAQVLSDFYERYGLYASDFRGNRLELIEWCLSDPDLINANYCERASTDALMEKLSSLPTVTQLSATGLTNSGIRHISQLHNIKSLYLQDSEVDDKTVELFVRLPKLQKINLINSEITDRGLRHFEKMSALKELYLHDCSITAAGVERLNRARPDLKVYSVCAAAEK